MRLPRIHLPVHLTLVTALLLGAGACASTDTGSDTESVTTESVVTVQDPWVKATEEDMTAVFGTLVNTGDHEVTVTGASSPVAPVVEIHEVVMSGGAMAMQEKADGITIPAGGSHLLEPGGDHLMLMELTQPIHPGDEVSITLTFADGTTLEFQAVAKPFAGGEETYHPHEGEH